MLIRVTNDGDDEVTVREILICHHCGEETELLQAEVKPGQSRGIQAHRNAVITVEG